MTATAVKQTNKKKNPRQSCFDIKQIHGKAKKISLFEVPTMHFVQKIRDNESFRSNTILLVTNRLRMFHIRTIYISTADVF